MLIDVLSEDPYVSIVEYEEFTELYKHIQCDLIEVVRDVKIGRGTYDLLLDENGLSRENTRLSGICKNLEQHLVGNMVILRNNKKGDFESITESDIIELQEHIMVNTYDMERLTPLLVYEHQLRGEKNENIRM